MRRFTLLAVALLVLTPLLQACESIETKAEYPTRRAGDADAVYGEREGIFGKGGLSIFDKDKNNAQNVGITVNAFLWRAALDTVSFMPLASADPFGGTIITDWYEAPEAKGERVKANILILSQTLRSDALRVSLFRQVRGSNGQWQDAAVNPKTVTNFEDAILTRARQLRVAATDE